MNRTLDDLLANVEESKTLAESLAVMMTGFREQHAEKVTGLTPTQQAQVNQLFDEIDASQATIIKAMSTNISPADPSLPV